jgi:hypothetical protein
MDLQGYFGNLVSTFEVGSNAAGLNFNQLAPNPAGNWTNLTFDLPQHSDVIVYVFDLNGKTILVNKLGQLAAGNNMYKLNTARLTSGQYVVGIVTEAGGVSQKLTVVK